MKLLFEPSGTHVKDKVLKVRFDFIPDLEDKTYPLHHVFVVDETRPEWLAGYKGKLNELGNPVNQAQCLSWFIQVPETFQLADFETYLNNLLNKDTIATLDNYLSLPDSGHYISPYCRSKPKFTTEKIVTADIESLKAAINAKFGVWEKPLEGGGTKQVIKRQSIDIGYPAANGGTILSGGITWIDLYNPANADGTIDTVHVWANTNMNNVNTVGMFYYSNPEYYCRDSEAIGSITAGAVRTITGLTINVVTGDFIGMYWIYSAGGNLEANDKGGIGVVRLNDEYKDPGDHASPLTTYTSYWMALDGTGTEAGGTTYDEIGKLQVLLAVGGKVDNQIIDELEKSQTVLAAQGNADNAIFSEMEHSQTILTSQGRSEYLNFTEPLGQVILTSHDRTDLAIFAETAKLQTILISQGKTDLAVFDEAGKDQVILAAHGGWAGSLFIETALEQLLLAQLGHTNLAVFNELSKLQAISILHGEVDSVIFEESGKLVAILISVSKTDLGIFSEIGRAETILASAGGVDSSIFSETARIQDILAAQGESDSYTPGSPFYDERGRLQLILVSSGALDILAQGLKMRKITARHSNLESIARGINAKVRTILEK